MAELATIARPYAEAVFRLAQESNALDAWSEALSLAQQISKNPDMQRLAADPDFGKERLAELFLGVCGTHVAEEARNFIRVVIGNDRLQVLDEIVAQYEAIKARASGVKEVSVASAFPLTAAQTGALVAKLETRFGCTVIVSPHVDPELIGGVVITVGDEVYDASVRGKLQDMAYTLNR